MCAGVWQRESAVLICFMFTASRDVGKLQLVAFIQLDCSLTVCPLILLCCAGAMRDEGYVEKANGFGGKVQRTFSGACDDVWQLLGQAPRCTCTQCMPSRTSMQWSDALGCLYALR
jgi:hypothetical protein